MWPWGHLAVGYLLYSLTTRVRFDRPPHAYPVLALAVGTQFPDLVDKPFAWTFGVLPTGRSLTHSLLTVVLLLVAVRLLVQQRKHLQLVAAFSVGYLSHLGGDALSPLLAGEIADLRFLVWPVLPAIESSTDKSFLAHFLSIELTAYFVAQLGLVVVACGVWVADGVPGLGLVWRTRNPVTSPKSDKD